MLRKPPCLRHRMHRIDIDSQYQAMPKRNDFPILVIDEFVPTNFFWDKEYTLQELYDRLGEPFDQHTNETSSKRSVGRALRSLTLIYLFCKFSQTCVPTTTETSAILPGMDTHVPDALAAENEKWRATLQAQDPCSPVAGCDEGLQDLFRGFFSTY